MLEVIQQNAIATLFGILSAGILGMSGMVLRHILKKQQEADTCQRELEEKRCIMERGIQALLRDRLVASYCHYRERGTITAHGLQNMELLYKEYTALGGNGFVTGLMEKIREMEVVET